MVKIYFGSPGAGKTTLAVRDMIRLKKKYRHCVSNFENSISGVKFDNDLNSKELFGHFAYPDDTAVFIDEASIIFNNRKYKTLSQEAIEYLKLHRHFKNDVYMYSQSWDDIDITARRLTTELWYIRKIGPFTIARKVRKYVTINETDYQIVDGYKFYSPLWTFIPLIGFKTFEIFLREPYYKYFNSFERPEKIKIKEL